MKKSGEGEGEEKEKEEGTLIRKVNTYIDPDDAWRAAMEMQHTAQSGFLSPFASNSVRRIGGRKRIRGGAVA